MIKAAELDIDPIWGSIFAKALAGKNMKDLIGNVGSASAVSAAPAAAAPAAGGAAKEEAKKEVKEESEESDDDMGFGGLF